MAKKDSVQKRLDKVRPPRVQLTYDVEVGDAIEQKEIPFVVGVLGDFAGQVDPDKPLPKLRDRKFVNVDLDNFDEVMQGVAPAATYRVKNRLSDQGGEFGVNLQFKQIDDFSPESVVQQVEPLRKLFKDEVRMVGQELGLPEEIVQRQPFPGPGLGIRIVGEVTKERLDLLRDADAIAREELTAAGLDREIWQCPVVLLADVRSVGVQGDGRTYGHPIVLRPVSSEDAMTADWSRLPYDVLARISTRITNEVRDVNRVVVDVTSKPPGTIEWE